MAFYLTGKGGAITNSEGHVLDRYLARAVNGVLTTAIPADAVPQERRELVDRMRWVARAEEAVREVGGAMVHAPDPGALPLETASFDICHSGGALEHYRPEQLQRFLAECFRVLRPGGIASHVVDHRDHLYHADKRLPFMAHLAVPDPLYRLAFGHPLGYHNRLLPTHVVELFCRAGFEPVVVRRMILPEGRYAETDSDAMCGKPGLERRWLTHRFRGAGDADLRTAAGHYVFRKPP